MKIISQVALNPLIQQPRYDRCKLKSRIVHLGFGAFHRAHQGVFIDRVLNQFHGDWGICAVSLSGDGHLIKALRAQDHLYSVVEKDADSTVARMVGAVTESLSRTLDGIEAILEKMAEQQVAIVSLTITEKGYCVLPGGQGLDLNHPAISADLSSPQQPHAAIGVIVEALRRRRERGLPAFSLLSCDNMPQNGTVLKQAVLAFAAAVEPALSEWIAAHASFPSSMVDRIVPALSSESEAEINHILGVADPCGIICEPFIQWVIEDDFVAGRPAWDKVGAELVQDVLPYEQMKLRMLNGSHSFLAYLGYLAGYQYISDCMADPAYRQSVRQLMLDEQAPTLNIASMDLTHYADRLIARFSNPSLKHRTWQIAMDGTQKLTQRMLAPLQWHLAHQHPFHYLALGIAGWMRYVGGIDDSGQLIDVRDPLINWLAQIVSTTADGVERVNGLLGITPIFGSLAENTIFSTAVTQSYLALMTHGARLTIEQCVNRE